MLKTSSCHFVSTVVSHVKKQRIRNHESERTVSGVEKITLAQDLKSKSPQISLQWYIRVYGIEY